MNQEISESKAVAVRHVNEGGLASLRWLVPVFLGAAAFVMLMLASVSPVLSDHAGYALSFDGNNDYVELAETALIMHENWEDTKSISLWVKPTASSACQGMYPSPPDCDLIFGDRERWFGITIGDRFGEDKIWIWNFDGSIDFIPVDYTLDAWVHITLVHDGGMLSAYRNGSVVDSIPSGTTLQPNTGAQPILHIGGMINNPSVNLTFTGLIDEVRLWNLARTPAEVQANMLQHLNGDEAGLAAYYQMSDGSGLTLSDDSLNDWSGALHDGGQGVDPDGSPPQWVTSDAFETPIETPTPTPTATSPGPTPTHTPTPTATPGPDPDDWPVYLPFFNNASSTS